MYGKKSPPAIPPSVQAACLEFGFARTSNENADEFYQEIELLDEAT